MDIPPQGSEIQKATTDPIESARRMFEKTFPDLRVTEICLKKGFHVAVGSDGWEAAIETGEFICHIRARRRD